MSHNSRGTNKTQIVLIKCVMGGQGTKKTRKKLPGNGIFSDLTPLQANIFTYIHIYIDIYLERKNHWTHICLLQTCFISIATQSSDKRASEKHWSHMKNNQISRTKKENRWSVCVFHFHFHVFASSSLFLCRQWLKNSSRLFNLAHSGFRIIKLFSLRHNLQQSVVGL